MSKSKKVTLFPELNKVKNVLWDAQGTFKSEKPKLNAAIKRLQPKGQTLLLERLESIKKSPLTKNFPAELKQELAETRHVMTQVESFLGDATSRRALQIGRMDITLNKLYAPLLDNNLQALDTLSSELKTLSYGTTSIEAFHLFETRINLLEIVITNFFETLDQRVPYAEKDSPLNQLFHNFRVGLAPLNERDEMKGVFELLANWKTRWQNKPFFAEQLAGVLPLAKITLERQKNLENYRKGDVIASIKALSGSLKRVDLAKGRLPRGLRLDKSSRQVMVSEPDALFPGSFGDLEFEVENSLGLISLVQLDDLEFGSDVEAYYNSIPIKPIADYEAGDVLSHPVDPDGAIVAAQVTGGQFPKGVRINTVNGVFSVSDPSKLVMGVYGIQVTTFDETGGETPHSINLSIGIERAEQSSTNSGPSDQDPVGAAGSSSKTTTSSSSVPTEEPAGGAPHYDTRGTFPRNMRLGTTLARVVLPEGRVTAARLAPGSTLPSGLRIRRDGLVHVWTPKEVVAGRFNFTVQIATSLNKTFLLNLALEFEERG